VTDVRRRCCRCCSGDGAKFRFHAESVHGQ
jgi:hypothetical protein